MKNSESCESANACEPTTNDLDVSGISDAAKILVERMKTKPEEFEPGGKFGHLRRACLQRLSPDPMLADSGFPVPLRDVHALLAACEKYIVEPAFTQHVLETVFAEPKQEEQRAYVQGGYVFYPPGQERMRLDSSGNLGIGAALSASNSVQANSIRLGQQTLTEDLIKKMKNKLGL